jgi:hypothetical protein
MTVVSMTFILPSPVHAQVNYEDVVYLKNGSIIHGVIIEQVPNQSIKIQTKDGNVFFYKIDEVEKLTKEPTKNTDNIQKKSGYTNITELNCALGVGHSNEDNSIGIQTINGYQFNPNLNLGFGVGVDKYKNSTYLPLFMDFRAYFLQTSVTPFFETALGYSLGFDNIKGGLLVNPSFGVKFFVTPKTALNFSVGYRYQEYTYAYSYPLYYASSYSSYSSGTVKETESSINFKFGATF